MAHHEVGLEPNFMIFCSNNSQYVVSNKACLQAWKVVPNGLFEGGQLEIISYTVDILQSMHGGGCLRFCAKEGFQMHQGCLPVATLNTSIPNAQSMYCIGQ